MTTTEHLNAIKAKCHELLAIAEKRTPGRWLINETQSTTVHDDERSHTTASTIGLWPRYKNAAADVAFITSAAGPFEASLRSTIVAIDDWLSLFVYTEGHADGSPDASAHDKLYNEVSSFCRINIQHILSAWPIELL